MRTEKKGPTLNGRDTRVEALLGGHPDGRLERKPMPLEAKFKAQWERRKTRQSERYRYSKAAFAPLLKIIEGDKEAMSAVRTLSRMKPPTPPKKQHIPRPHVEERVRSGSILALRTPPYDDTWLAGSGSTSTSTNLGDPEADPNTGEFGVHTVVQSDAGSEWAGAGVGVWFQPVADNTIVRIAADCPGDCYWDDSSSWGDTAHTTGLIGVLSQSWDLNWGNYASGDTNQTYGDINRQIQLWSDGTGWNEEHGFNNDFTVWFPNDTYATLSAGRHYFIWMYCVAFCDGDGQGVVGSTSDAVMGFQNYFFVFEQWT